MISRSSSFKIRVFSKLPGPIWAAAPPLTLLSSRIFIPLMETVDSTSPAGVVTDAVMVTSAASGPAPAKMKAETAIAYLDIGTVIACPEDISSTLSNNDF
jgi:hypothetical protein